MNPEPVLCYVDGPWAYFTTKPLKEQWGDDWNDAPYEHNAGSPYEPCWHRNEKPCDCELCRRDYFPDGAPRWRIVRVAIETDLGTPADRAPENGEYSVEQINSGAIPWLQTSRWSPRPGIQIWAGVGLSEFKRLVRLYGGKVYILDDDPSPPLESPVRKALRMAQAALNEEGWITRREAMLALVAAEAELIKRGE